MKKYFYVLEGQSKGPSSSSDLLEQGISKETLVWADGMTDWASAGSVSEIAQLFAPTPPPIPVSAPVPTPPPIPTSSDSLLTNNVSDPNPEILDASNQAYLEELIREQLLENVANGTLKVVNGALVPVAEVKDDSEEVTIGEVFSVTLFATGLYYCCTKFHGFTTKYYGWWIFGFFAFVAVVSLIRYLSQLASPKPSSTIDNMPYVSSTSGNSEPRLMVAAENKAQYKGEQYIKKQTQYQPQQYKQERGEVVECKWCGNELNMRGSAKANYGGWDVCSQKCRKDLSASISRGEMRVKNHFFKWIAKWVIFLFVCFLAALFTGRV